MDKIEKAALVKAALVMPGQAFISDDGRNLIVSFAPREVHVYSGQDFSAMTAEELTEFVNRMDQ